MSMYKINKNIIETVKAKIESLEILPYCSTVKLDFGKKKIDPVLFSRRIFKHIDSSRIQRARCTKVRLTGLITNRDECGANFVKNIHF